MAQKTVKKAAAKPAAAKKAPVKKTVAVKKPAAKKATAKEVKMTAPVMEKMPCGCGADCHCKSGHDCGCGAQCRCHGGSRFGRFMRKLVLFLIIFALGFAAAKLCCCGPRHHGARMHFVNGCLDAASVKCPKLVEALPAMDINGDGCITRDEFRAVKRQMRAEVRDIEVQEVEVQADVAE